MSRNPFSPPAEGSDKIPWWLRDADDEELEYHRRLLDELTDLESQWHEPPPKHPTID